MVIRFRRPFEGTVYVKGHKSERTCEVSTDPSGELKREITLPIVDGACGVNRIPFVAPYSPFPTSHISLADCPHQNNGTHWGYHWNYTAFIQFHSEVITSVDQGMEFTCDDFTPFPPPTPPAPLLAASRVRRLVA